MWLITKIPQQTLSKNSDAREELLDLCLGIAPQVSIAHDPYVLISLKSVSRYWNLPALRKSLETEVALPFFEKLRSLHLRFGIEFVIAPTAPWALAIFESAGPAAARNEFSLPDSIVRILNGEDVPDPTQHFSRTIGPSVNFLATDFLRLFNLEEAKAFLLEQKISANRPILGDVFSKNILGNKDDRLYEFNQIVEDLADLGITETQKLYSITRDVEKKTAFVTRFGPLLKKFLRRLDGVDDFELPDYQPASILSERVYVETEPTRSATTASHFALNAALMNVGAKPLSKSPAESRDLLNPPSPLKISAQVEAKSADETFFQMRPLSQELAQDLSMEFAQELPKENPLPNYSSDTAHASVLNQIFEVLNKWEGRLAARKSLLRGFVLRLYSGRKRKSEEIIVNLPRATRSADSLFKIFYEQWLAHGTRSSKAYLASADGEVKSSAFFDEDIESFEVESLAIEADRDRQLDLFDPSREDVEEKWGLLVAQIRSRELRNKPIFIGSYKPQESFLPEQSLKWVEWEENLRLDPIEDHPKRPLILLRTPQVLIDPELHDEDDFIKFCEEHSLFSTLEKISDPWSALQSQRTAFSSGKPGERSYVRWQDKWLFWEHRQKRLFLHGYFE